MKTKKKLILALICFSLNSFLYCQNEEECGTDIIHQRLMQTDANYRNEILKLDNQIHAKLQNHSFQTDSSQVYTIPVVVYVIHLGEPIGTGSNISDEQIQGAIQGLNDRFQYSIGNDLDIQIKFCLAVRDPNGCKTNGINRVDGSGVPNYSQNGIEWYNDGGANVTAIKSLSIWSHLEYYNIWVVNKIPGSVAGYANYPTGYEFEGTVIEKNYMKKSYTVLTHELGHGLNLCHTFNGEINSNCPANNDCTIDGDKVCDTPPHKQNDCGSTNPCSGDSIWDNSRKNYMSYCGNANRFTQGQKDRMKATLLTYPRKKLITSLGKIPSDFIANVSQIVADTCLLCTNGKITLNVTGGTLPYQYSWSNNIISTLNSLDSLTSGYYSVTVTDHKNCIAMLDSINIAHIFVNNVIRETIIDQIEVFPNPAQQNINIEINNPKLKDISIKIYSLSGQEMENTIINLSDEIFRYRINLNNYPAQLYLLKIMIGDKSEYYKIAIIK